MVAGLPCIPQLMLANRLEKKPPFQCGTGSFQELGSFRSYPGHKNAPRKVRPDRQLPELPGELLPQEQISEP